MSYNKKLLLEARGATAIEYGLIAGGIGVTIAAAVFVLGVDLSNLLSDTSGVLSSGETNSEVVFRSSFDVDDPNTGAWTGGSVVNVPGFGDVLRMDGSNRFGSAGLGTESVSTTFDLPENTQSTTIAFDMVLADSWDNEHGRVFINGEEVASVKSNWRKDAPQFEITGSDAITVSTELLDSYQGTGTWRTNTSQMDHAFRVSIDVENPGESVSLGFGNTLNQSASDESLLIDNMNVSAK